MGKSLTFRGTVYEASELMRTHRCKDPICDTHLWKVKHELDMAKIRMRKLEDELRGHGVTPVEIESALSPPPPKQKQRERAR
jgi:ionotropic glutamate receptor NMDA 2B